MNVALNGVHSEVLSQLRTRSKVYVRDKRIQASVQGMEYLQMFAGPGWCLKEVCRYLCDMKSVHSHYMYRYGLEQQLLVLRTWVGGWSRVFECGRARASAVGVLSDI